MTATFFLLLIGLELKHYLADYFFQPGWMLAQKGNFRKPGGYVHAGIHAVLSAVVLLIAATPFTTVLMILVAEFVLHYALDHFKIVYSKGAHVDTTPRRFWMLHGLDQFLHQLTYAAMIYLALSAKGLI